VIDTVIIEYLYRAPIFVHYGHAGRALSARCRRSHRALWVRRWTDGYLPRRTRCCVHGRLARLFLIGFRQSSPARIPFMSVGGGRRGQFDQRCCMAPSTTVLITRRRSAVVAVHEQSDFLLANFRAACIWQSRRNFPHAARCWYANSTIFTRHSLVRAKGEVLVLLYVFLVCSFFVNDFSTTRGPIQANFACGRTLVPDVCSPLLGVNGPRRAEKGGKWSFRYY